MNSPDMLHSPSSSVGDYLNSESLVADLPNTGLSVAISSPCLYYLLRNWKSHSSHIIVLCFSITISAFNLVAFVLKTFSLGKHIRSLPCPTYTNITAFQFSNSASGTLISSSHIGADTLFTAIFPVVFLILNDGFLVREIHTFSDKLY